MHKFKSILTLAVLVTAGSVFAIDFDDLDEHQNDNFVPGILCDACRDPYEHPMDFVAVGYNAFFGDNPWLIDSNVSWPFRVYNLQGRWVNLWFEDLFFYTPSLLPRLITVMLQQQNGQVLHFSVMYGSSDLPIGDPDSIVGNRRCGCGSSGSADGDNYDADEGEGEEDDFDLEETEPTGFVEIIDPDEDGEFPPWEEEL